MVLEILAEKGLVREIELVGYLLNAQRRIFQQVLRLEYDETVDLVGSRTSAGLADDRRQIFGREVQLVGIEPDRPLLHVVA